MNRNKGVIIKREVDKDQTVKYSTKKKKKIEVTEVPKNKELKDEPETVQVEKKRELKGKNGLLKIKKGIEKLIIFM